MRAHGTVRLPLVHARALPGGAVEREFYESVKGTMSKGARREMPTPDLAPVIVH